MKPVLKYADYRDEFIRWIHNKGLSERYAKNTISYLDKYLMGVEITSPLDVSQIRENATSKKSVTVAIRVLLNFYEEMDLLDEGFINKLRRPLKVIRSNPDNYVPGDEVVLTAYAKISPKYEVMFELLACSGIRATEAIMFFKEYTPEKLEIVGNVARYPLFAIRRNKRSYFVYFPASLVEKLKPASYTWHGLSNAFIRAGLPSKYLRKWNYNFLIMHNVPESVADFIQGRSPVSVGSMHYLAKVKQADYWYAKVADELEKIFTYEI